MLFFEMLSMIEDEQERLRIADIYEEHRYSCLHIAKGITKNQQTAEDSVQDAFIEVIKNKEKIFALDCNFLLPYIVTIVKHKCFDIMKKQNRISDTPIDELELEIDSGEIPVDDKVISQMGYDRLVELISGLHENYRTVIEMKYILELSIKEIADELDISQENVKVRIHRAKSQLRKLLGSEVKTNV